MSAFSTRKQCTHDDGCKQVAVTNCEGCSKAFCIKHFTNHRSLLEEEMKMIIDEHDLLKNSLDQQINKPLIKEVDQWEKESMEKVQQRANELRQELLQSTVNSANDLSKNLQQLSDKLAESRENDSFIETDLQSWKNTLSNLKANLTSTSTASINRRDNISLVQNISINVFTVTNDIFQYSSDSAVKISNNGQAAVRDRSQYCTGLRGKQDYITGHHHIRLRIDRFKGHWVFFWDQFERRFFAKFFTHV